MDTLVFDDFHAAAVGQKKNVMGWDSLYRLLNRPNPGEVFGQQRNEFLMLAPGAHEI
jgi:hypothetical protein